jgi:hypothetical protein
MNSLQAAAAAAGTIMATPEEQLQMRRNGLAAHSAAAQQITENAAAADAALRQLDRAARLRWFDVSIPACAARCDSCCRGTLCKQTLKLMWQRMLSVLSYSVLHAECIACTDRFMVSSAVERRFMHNQHLPLPPDHSHTRPYG